MQKSQLVKETRFDIRLKQTIAGILPSSGEIRSGNGSVVMDGRLMHQRNEVKERRADERRGVLPVVEGWARSMYESSGWGSRWEWVEFFSSRGTWHSLIGGDGPGEGWWGADEDDGRDGGSSEEEEVGGSGRPEAWRERKNIKEERRGRGAVRQNRWQWLTVKQARLLRSIRQTFAFLGFYWNWDFLLWIEMKWDQQYICDRKHWFI